MPRTTNPPLFDHCILICGNGYKYETLYHKASSVFMPLCSCPCYPVSDTVGVKGFVYVIGTWYENKNVFFP